MSEQEISKEKELKEVELQLLRTQIDQRLKKIELLYSMSWSVPYRQIADISQEIAELCEKCHKLKVLIMHSNFNGMTIEESEMALILDPTWGDIYGHSIL